MRDVRNRETEREHNKGKRERGTVIQGGRKRGNDRIQEKIRGKEGQIERKRGNIRDTERERETK